MTKPIVEEVWEGFRPYVRHLAIDFLIAATLWVLLAAFQWVTRFMSIDEEAGKFISVVHSAGVVAVFAVLAIGSVWDIIQLKRGKVS